MFNQLNAFYFYLPNEDYANSTLYGELNEDDEDFNPETGEPYEI